MPLSYAPLGEQHSGVRSGTPTRSYFYEESSKSGGRFSNRSHFTPSCSPPNSYSPSNSRTKCFSDDSRDDSNRSFDYGGRAALLRNSILPPSSYDATSGEILFSFERIVADGLFEIFAKDKIGCHFLQEHYPAEGSALRYRLYGMMEDNELLVEEMCKDVFANFFVQKMIEKSTRDEQKLMAVRLGKSMFVLCMNRYACRVIQKALEHFPDEMKIPLIHELHDEDLVMLAVDQNANHVIQKIFNSFDLDRWSFIISALLDNMFFSVVENKYGCRIMQLAIELLSGSKMNPFAYEARAEAGRREQLLEKIMDKLTENCERLSSNEFANYVIQHVITAPSLTKYRDQIIEKCLLGKLLLMSQEKYASHVVEKAMEHANTTLLKEMIDEIFDGYVPHPESKRDALDILLFHQFGNYVIQRMLIICSSQHERRLDDRTRSTWMALLEDRIIKCTGRLSRYSSGKKILDMLRSARGQPPLNHGVVRTSGAIRTSPRKNDHYQGVGQSSLHQNQYNSDNLYYHLLHNNSFTNPGIPEMYR